MEQQQARLLAATVQTHCFADLFTESLARVFGAPAAPSPVTVPAELSAEDDRLQQSACTIQKLARGVLARRSRAIDGRVIKRRRPAPGTNMIEGAHVTMRALAPSPPPQAATGMFAARPAPPSNPTPALESQQRPGLLRAQTHSQPQPPQQLQSSLTSNSRSASAQSLPTRPNQRSASALSFTTPDSLAAQPAPASNSPISPKELDRLADGVLAPTSHFSGPFKPPCLLQAEARLMAQRRLGGRNQATTALSVTQLLDERRALKHELQLAREKHTPLARDQHTTPVVGPRSQQPTKHVRSRSLSPAPAKSALCDGCPIDADWKTTYQPLLFLWSSINATLKSKGVNPAASDSSTQAAQPTLLGSRPNSANSANNTPLFAFGPSTTASSPLLSLVNGLGSGAASSAAANRPLAAPQFGPGAAASNALPVTRARGVRKGVAAGSSVASGALASTPGNGVVRAGSRSSSPAPGGVVAPSNSFAQWSQQSTATLQAAQLPVGKSAATSSSSVGGAAKAKRPLL